MTPKQLATVVAPLLLALGAVLSQCPDEAPAPPAPRSAPPAHSPDAGKTTRRDAGSDETR
jgi:hypothetical protein